MSTANIVLPKARNGGDQVPTIDVDLLCQELESHRRVVIVDVRSRNEYRGARGHIAGAISIPLHQLLSRWKELAPHRYDLVVIVSERGVTSRLAALELEFAGFDDVRTLEGGMTQWWERRYPVVVEHGGRRHL